MAVMAVIVFFLLKFYVVHFLSCGPELCDAANDGGDGDHDDGEHVDGDHDDARGCNKSLVT